MRRIGIITFHSSYNHGSALQAFALQTFLNDLLDNNDKCEIINLRTKRQKEFYKRPYGSLCVKDLARRIMLLGYKKQILERKERYESFIAHNLRATEEYASLDEISNANIAYDYLVCGSDQIWNYKILDFDWSFFLEFNEKAKKISYAASFGPILLDPTGEQKKRIRKDLESFSAISVREQGSIANLKRISQKLDAEMHVDPTLLLSCEKWQELCKKRLIDGDYIFLYDLKGNDKAYDIARKLSEQYGNIPVIVVKERGRKRFFGKNFIKRFNAGPTEFLSYIKYAKIVVSSSFHGNVFSMIFRKPFIAVGGKKDFRINNILTKASLKDRAIDNPEDIDQIRSILDVDFSGFDRMIREEKKRTKEYFMNAFEVKK